MTSILRGPRPDITPAQIVGVLVAGVPVVAALLRAFGAYETTPDQQQALQDALVWCGVTAGALFASDAGVRAARNAADARRDVAALSAPGTPPVHAPEDLDDAPDGRPAMTDADLAAMLAAESGAVPDVPEDRR